MLPEVAFLRTDPRVPDYQQAAAAVAGDSGRKGDDNHISWLNSCIGGVEDGSGNSTSWGAEVLSRMDNWWAQTRWRMLLVGQRNSTMFLHRDDIETATWQAQVVGRKRCVLVLLRQLKYHPPLPPFPGVVAVTSSFIWQVGDMPADSCPPPLCWRASRTRRAARRWSLSH